MQCHSCGKDLPTEMRAGTQYCGTACRSRAFRRRAERSEPRETAGAGAEGRACSV